MPTTRSPSIAGPAETDDELRLVLAAYRLLERARLLGVIDEAGAMAPTTEVGEQARGVARRLAGEGVGRVAAAQAAEGPADAGAIERLLDALDANPLPEREWGPLRALLGDELLGALAGVSQSSLGRYASGTRATPDVVAARLHLLTMVLADLRGGYNDYGIRRWFVRPRPSLEGASILDLLGPGWDPDGPAAERVRSLAAAVLSIGAT